MCLRKEDTRDALRSAVSDTGREVHLMKKTRAPVRQKADSFVPSTVEGETVKVGR